MKITRELIINKLKEQFEPNPDVYSLWLEGADALDAVDKYSDLDIWFDVRDGQEKQIMRQVKKAFSEFGELDLAQDYHHHWIMEPMVELLRIKYRPLTHGYHLVHISQHLPKKIVKQVEELYKVTSLSDIAKKTKKAEKLAKKIVKSL